MNECVGTLDLNRLTDLISQDLVHTVLALFPDHYGRLMGKKFDATHFLNHVSKKGTHVCRYLLTTDIEMNPVAGYTFANWDQGYGDMCLVPDLATLRMANWLDKSTVVLCDAALDTDGSPVAESPRAILKQQEQVAKDAGFSTLTASELEYYLFTNSYGAASSQHYYGMQPIRPYIIDYHARESVREAEFQGALRQHLNRSGIPIEGTKGEWGFGQMEVNLKPSSAIEMADRHSLLKLCVKSLADQKNLSATFMAKVYEKQAGSGCHLHLSLWREAQTHLTVESHSDRSYALISFAGS